MKKIFALLVFMSFLSVNTTGEVFAQETLLATEVIIRSIDYHDPDGNWNTAGVKLKLYETSPDSNRNRTSEIHWQGDGFSYVQHRKTATVAGRRIGEDWTASIDGSTEFSDSLRKQYRLHPEGIYWYRDYYVYMRGLPMKLQDPGMILEENAVLGTFMDKPAYIVTTNYTEEVGSDEWEFYFDPETYAIIGCRFYHDRAKNDGEYIPFTGEVEVAGMRLYKAIHWYTNTGDRFLGTDTILEASEADLN